MSRGAGKSQTAADLWHLSISDLLASPEERAPLAGQGPVVINLSTSTAHIGPPPQGMRHFDGLHLYQIRRGPEDEPQYLLRLGIIASDIEADVILSSVLEHYPGATKASPEEDDRTAIAAQAQAARQPPKPATPSAPPAKPAAKPALKHPEARHRAPKAAPAFPAAAAKSPEPVRWDIDELLPDLAVTRPSKPKPPAPTVAPARAWKPVISPAPAPRTEPAPRTGPAPAIRTEQPAAASLPASRKEQQTPACSAPAQPERPVISRLPMVRVELPVIAPVPEPVVEVQAQAPRAPEVAEAFEFTLPAPEPAAVRPDPVTSEVEFSHDSDAVTHEVPLPTFEFDAPEIETPMPAAFELTLAYEDVPPTIELLAADVEPPTVEVRAAVVLTVEGQTSRLTPVEPTAAPVDTAAATLEQLVAKIDAMVESVDHHEKEQPQPPIAPRIDSTQTLRALTALELADDQSSPWFAIQLAFADEQIDPEQVPDLDLFNEYRLYCVTGLHEDRIMHSLRLGFFSSELAAEAVAGYLRGFFDAPCIKRVSVAERERFAQESMTARKDIGATGVHAVIELTSPKALPERQASVGATSTSTAQSSIWSRFVTPLKR